MINELWSGGPRFIDTGGVFRLGTDSVLLADFAGSSLVRKKKRAADLGCGSGIISILLVWNDPGLSVDGVEIDPGAVRLALENAKVNGFDRRFTIMEKDLRRHREYLQAGAYDISVSNPPYYGPESGKLPSNPDRVNARVEELCTLDDVCGAAGYITRWGGSFMLVHKPQRLADIFRSLDRAGFEPKRIRFVQHKQNTPPSLVLIESRRGGKPMLGVEAPLIMANEDGSDSDEVKRIYRRS